MGWFGIPQLRGLNDVDMLLLDQQGDYTKRPAVA
jgi:hypothetical protein